MRESWDDAEQWRMTMVHSPIGMAVIGLDGHLLLANQKLCDMLGYDEDGIRGLGFQEMTHPNDRETNTELVARALAGDTESFRWQKRYVRADGRIVWGDCSVALVRSRDGAPSHYVAQVLDVTEQRQHEERLKAAMAEVTREQQALTAIFETVSVGLLLIGPDGHYERMNGRHRATLELTFPEGHRGQAGQLGEVYLSDGKTLMGHEDMPSTRAVRGEEFDDYCFWVGTDPRSRAAFSVSARQVRGPAGESRGSALAYQEITELMRAKQVQDEFLASVSHELRTPLTAMVGYLEILGEQEGLPAGATTQLQIVERNARRLQALLSDLLQVGQAAEGDISLHRTEVDLGALTHEAVEATRPMAEKYGVVVDVRTADGVIADIDKHRIRQVLDNLLSNAVKYTDTGGQVEVVLTQTTTAIELTVSDTGIGIAQGETEQVFDRFFRGERALEGQVPGTGLGLNIVHAIVEAHDGDVTLESTLGQGSTFRVRLPRPLV